MDNQFLFYNVRLEWTVQLCKWALENDSRIEMYLALMEYGFTNNVTSILIVNVLMN